MLVLVNDTLLSITNKILRDCIYNINPLKKVSKPFGESKQINSGIRPKRNVEEIVTDTISTPLHMV